MPGCINGATQAQGNSQQTVCKPQAKTEKKSISFSDLAIAHAQLTAMTAGKKESPKKWVWVDIQKGNKGKDEKKVAFHHRDGPETTCKNCHTDIDTGALKKLPGGDKKNNSLHDFCTSCHSTDDKAKANDKAIKTIKKANECVNCHAEELPKNLPASMK